MAIVLQDASTPPSSVATVAPSTPPPRTRTLREQEDYGEMMCLAPSPVDRRFPPGTTFVDPINGSIIIDGPRRLSLYDVYSVVSNKVTGPVEIQLFDEYGGLVDDPGRLLFEGERVSVVVRRAVSLQR